ncbi:hypothetical protein B0H16DRAFT_56598 [Mycena metata]|uniref:Uncharacterized protein n=1 Tax=Mycena metata TaxID=1033252 RepID=A0AAD7ID09_9AGAR|nr:hypothetical protein B0H16DRAFT_56598 [Mycena metata]
MHLRCLYGGTHGAPIANSYRPGNTTPKPKPEQRHCRARPPQVHRHILGASTDTYICAARTHAHTLARTHGGTRAQLLQVENNTTKDTAAPDLHRCTDAQTDTCWGSQKAKGGRTARVRLPQKKRARARGPVPVHTRNPNPHRRTKTQASERGSAPRITVSPSCRKGGNTTRRGGSGSDDARAKEKKSSPWKPPKNTHSQKKNTYLPPPHRTCDEHEQDAGGDDADDGEDGGDGAFVLEESGGAVSASGFGLGFWIGEKRREGEMVVKRKVVGQGAQGAGQIPTCGGVRRHQRGLAFTRGMT